MVGQKVTNNDLQNKKQNGITCTVNWSGVIIYYFVFNYRMFCVLHSVKCLKLEQINYALTTKVIFRVGVPFFLNEFQFVFLV